MESRIVSVVGEAFQYVVVDERWVSLESSIISFRKVKVGPRRCLHQRKQRTSETPSHGRTTSLLVDSALKDENMCEAEKGDTEEDFKKATATTVRIILDIKSTSFTQCTRPCSGNLSCHSPSGAHNNMNLAEDWRSLLNNPP